MRRAINVLVFGALALGACSDRDAAAPPGPTARLAIAVAPLALPGIGDAEYTLQVFNGDPAQPSAELVVEATHLASTRYGDGAGSLGYVAPCDASTGTNYVRLILESLSDTGGTPLDPATYMNPTPVTKPVACVANTDTRVDFNLTVLRQANQGFFDVAVSFTNIFCSAKFDCRDEDGAPLVLLHDPDGERTTTMVMAFACTSGMGATTWLHFSDVAVVCGEGASSETWWVSPAGPDGNQGPLAPLFFQRALYLGDEQLPDYDKCYWNQAFGLALTAPASCRVVADATASVGSWQADAGRSPADTIYPYVHFEVPFTNDQGALACGRHALNAGDLRVTTRYTGFTGATFAYERRCGGPDEQIAVTEAPHVTCGAQVVGAGASDSVLFDSASGVSVDINGARSPAYALPEGLVLGGCCLNPCCTE